MLRGPPVPFGEGPGIIAPVARLLSLLLLVGALAGCGGDDEVACGPVTEEALDPASGLHILPDEDPPAYATDPPTSGAHYAIPPPTGTLDEPLDRPMQVTVLEVGGVLVQHRDLSDAEVDDLVALADDVTVVAPNPDLDEPVVLTAWLAKQTCSGVDAAAVAAFIEERQGTGPGVDF